MKNQIERQADCIHLSLDQGFYGTEPLGLSPAKAIELSLKKIKSIRDGHQKGKWVSLPIDAKVDDAAKTEVEEISSEDKVITTPFTYIATAEVIKLLGATPVFVDIDSDTFNIDPKTEEYTATI